MSSNVYLSNIDDYLAPSQACINPLFTTDKDTKSSGKEVGGEGGGGGGEEKKENEASTQTTETAANAVVVPRQRHRRKRVSARMNLGSNSNNDNDKSSKDMVKPPAIPSDPVKASIQDCLACSGCVTTAETVLMEQQHSLTLLRDMVAARSRSIAIVTARGDSDAMDTLDQADAMDKLDQADQADLPEIVVTVSPASWADLLRHIMGGALDDDASDTENAIANARRLREYQRKLTTLLHRTLHVSTVMDGNLPLQWSLQQAGDEFCRAHRRKYAATTTAATIASKNQNKMNAGTSNMHGGDTAMVDTTEAADTTSMMSEQERLQQLLMPSQALSSSVSVYRRPDGSQVECRTDQQEWRQQQALPLITSSCPAVVCLLEKSAHAAVPHLSTTKSSMAAAGAYWKQQKQQQQHQLLKNGTIAPALPTTTTTNATAATTSTSTPAKSYFHLAIMPCHDKKLEASRKDFQEDASAESAKDVDMVITTSECFQLLLELLVASDAAATAATANSTSTATADAGASANPTSDANDTASHDNGSDKDAVAAAGIAMVRNYLESLPMAPVQESVGPCRPMTTTTTTTTLQLDNDNGIESTTTARTKESSATLMALPSTTTTAAATTTTTVTAKAAAKLVPSTASASTSNDAFFALGSGGYADFVFRYAAREIYGVDIDAVPWTPVTGAQVVAGGGGGGARPPQQRSARVATSAQRRRDFYQATLYRSSDGSYFTFDETTGTGPEVGGGGQSKSNEAVLRFAVAYGMQTIQRVFEPFQDKQQTGGGAASSSSTSMAAAPAPAAVSPYDYIEAMACPSGCLNGGGQNRVAERETPTETRQRVAKTTQFFVATNDDSQTSTSSSSNSTVAVAQAPLEPAQLVTSYHVVPPLELSMGAAAGVAVKDIEW